MRVFEPVLTENMGGSLLQCGDFHEQLDGKSARNWNWSPSLTLRSDSVITDLEGISNQLFRTGFGLGSLSPHLMRAVLVIQLCSCQIPSVRQRSHTLELA